MGSHLVGRVDELRLARPDTVWRRTGIGGTVGRALLHLL
jgi:hypothetical protein